MAKPTGADWSGPCSVFAGLRRVLEEQARQIAERLEAVADAEAALGRLAALFAPPKSGRAEAPGRGVGASDTRRPPEHNTPAVATTVAEQTANLRVVLGIVRADAASWRSAAEVLQCSAPQGGERGAPEG